MTTSLDRFETFLLGTAFGLFLAGVLRWVLA